MHCFNRHDFHRYANPFLFLWIHTHTHPCLPMNRWDFAWKQPKCDCCAQVTRCRHWPQVFECQMWHFWSEDQQNGKKTVHYYYFIFKHYSFWLWLCFAMFVSFHNFFYILYLPLDMLIIKFKLYIFSCGESGNAQAELQLRLPMNILIYKRVNVFFAFIPHPSWGASLNVSETVQHHCQSFSYMKPEFVFLHCCC